MITKSTNTSITWRKLGLNTLIDFSKCEGVYKLAHELGEYVIYKLATADDLEIHPRDIVQISISKDDMASCQIFEVRSCLPIFDLDDTMKLRISLKEI